MRIFHPWISKNLNNNLIRLVFQLPDAQTIATFSHGFMFKLFDNKLNKKVTSKYNYSRNDEFTFYIFENRDNFVNFGPVDKFIDKTIPYEIEEWEKMNKPGFFKRVFKRG